MEVTDLRKDMRFNCCYAILLYPANSGIEKTEELIEKKLRKLPIEIVAYFKGVGIRYSSQECLCSCLVDITEWEGNDILFLRPLDGYKISRITVKDEESVRFTGRSDRGEKYILLRHNGSLFMISMENDTERKLRKSKEEIIRLEKSLKRQEEFCGGMEDERGWGKTFKAMSEMPSEGHGRLTELFQRTNKKQREINKLLEGKSPEELETIRKVIEKNVTGKRE
ncbi:hypothetical protein KAK05_01465 [Candidatus Parcubacteria bacterium]|nr:hypothetical protein [Candidatus Parcubacteria bacterium]